MKTTRWRSLALALIVVGASSVMMLALPSFSDENIAAGNLNPTDTIKVMEIEVRRSSSEDVTLSAINIRNLGTAGSGEIEKIIVEDGPGVLGEEDNLAGIDGVNGVTINLGGYEMTNTTHRLRIFVVVGTTVSGGETIEFECIVDYVRNGLAGSSGKIRDLSAETIENGGFDEIEDSSPEAGYLNPLDDDVVQIAVFIDNDANGSPVMWDIDNTQTDSSVIVRVENLGSGTAADIDEVRVTITIGGDKYTTGWINWNPGSPMDFTYGFVNANNPGFYKDADEDGVQDSQTPADALPLGTEDNATTTIQTEFRLDDKDSVTDNRTIRTETTVLVTEEGEGDDGEVVAYEQSERSEEIQTIREQGFERVDEESENLTSGTAATGDVIVQTVRLTDEDSNANDPEIRRFYVRNSGSADGDEIDRIVVKAGATELLDIDGGPGGDLDDFKTGDWFDILPADYFDVDDDEDQVMKIYYTIGTPTDGHTFRPVVRFSAREGGEDYPCDEATYPDTLALYEPGFEFVENTTPPEGGTAYSGQRLLAQKIWVEDRDEDDDDVVIDPVVVKNIGSASGNPDITKIEVWRQDEKDGPETKMGEEDDLGGLKTGGVRVDIDNDNVVQDAAGGSGAWILIYLQIAEPEEMVEGRTIQLETRVLHTERNGTYDKVADSNQWTLEANHRPEVDFTFEEAATGAASIGPKQDFTYEQTIQFNGEATDPDGDAIATWHWDFGDGNTSDERNPTHQYPNGGTFEVTLTVTDDRGVTGSATKTIEVAGPPNQPPVINEIDADPQNPGEGGNVNFTADVTDPDQPAGTAFEYLWDFGDETATSTAAAPQHTFDEAGEYTVTLTVTDAQGATDTETIDISVGNEVPTVASISKDPATGNTGEPVTFTAQGVEDADGDNVDEYQWDYGDGTTSTTNGNTTDHVYAVPGTYTVTLVAVDARGGQSEAVEVEITIEGPTRVIVRAYPNPAANSTTIEFFMPEGSTNPVLRIFDLAQKVVIRRDLADGDTAFVWNLRGDAGESVANGLYFIVITAESATGRSMTSEVFRLLIAQ